MLPRCLIPESRVIALAMQVAHSNLSFICASNELLVEHRSTRVSVSVSNKCCCIALEVTVTKVQLVVGRSAKKKKGKVCSVHLKYWPFCIETWLNGRLKPIVVAGCWLPLWAQVACHAGMLFVLLANAAAARWLVFDRI